MAIEDLTGRQFGRLTVKKLAEPRYYGKSRQKQVFWLCECSCGKPIEVRANGLKTGNTQSCGCLYGTHKQTGSPTYNSWVNMIQRCTNPSDKCWDIYGGRGITVCDRWRHSFENFLEDMGERPAKKSLDRKDPNGDYTPDNCVWATAKEQANNKRNSRWLEYQGQKKTVAEWADATGIGSTTILYRLASGWAIEDVLTIKPDSRNRIKESGKNFSQPDKVA